jgi:pimeloyl-ACP methyl ester carboxylesterase
VQATSATQQDRTVAVCGLNQYVRVAGTGAPIVVVHHDIGNPGWLPFHDLLARQGTLYVPDLPGYGQSERPAWARHPRDLAVMLQLLLDKLEIERATLVGLGFGGWIAAEMATMSQRRFPRLVLVGAMGIKPAEGEILDQIMVSVDEYVRRGFADTAAFERQFGSELTQEQIHAWDAAREMTARIAWKPYMFSHQLPHLISGVTTPTLVVWGRQDGVVPLVCGEAYARAMPHARLEVLDGCGHFVEMEQPEALAELIARHMESR